MSIHGRAAWDYIPNPPRRSPFFGGAVGGGGLAVVVCTLPCAGWGSPVGAPSGLAVKTRWRPLGLWVPWFPPPPWGEGVRTCANRRWDGGRDGGTTCPGTCGAPVPLASSRHSPATGEGATSRAEVE